MAKYLRTQTPLGFFKPCALFVFALCGLSYPASAQWDLDAMLATKTDWFAHQCYISNEPRLKAVTFMAVGDQKLFRFVIQDNDMIAASYDLDHNNGFWKVAGEQVAGGGEEIKKEIYRLNFRLMTSKQFTTLIKTQPKDACKG
jgi:hypothetical protein